MGSGSRRSEFSGLRAAAPPADWPAPVHTYAMPNDEPLVAPGSLLGVCVAGIVAWAVLIAGALAIL